MATIPSRKATFTEEEKRKLVEGTDAQGRPLSEAEKMKLSKMHTARTLGADWREKAAERSKAEEPARARQALAERAAATRSAAPKDYKLPTKADEFQDIPGGGKVKIGAETLKRMQGFEKQRSEAKAAEDIKKQNIIYAAQERASNALRQRYEDELASRGFAPPKTRQEQEAIDKARMEEFDTITVAKNAAKMKEKQAVDEARAYKQLARMARRSGDFVGAAAYNQEVLKRDAAAGGDIRNATARRSVFEDREMQAAMERIKQTRAARRDSMQKQNISNPEASSCTTTSSDAPLAVGSDMPSYQLPYQRPAGPAEQPFGMTTPVMGDYGVDFSSISPYNTSETRITETEDEVSSPATRSLMPATRTSKQQTIEGVLPRASNMPVVQRNPRETAAQHNARVMQEYEKNVVIPSFDKQTQDALISATELNRQKDQLFSQRFTSPERSKQYKDVSEKASKQQDVLKKSIDKLRAEKRNMAKYPMNSKERQFIDLQIATLQNQLGFIAKRLY